MDRDGLLQSIAETGYNVGFGAKKHFATYDIVEKMPGLIGFVSIAVGIYSLVFEQLSTKAVSATLTVAGVCALYITFYEHNKLDYERRGKELTQLFNQLRDLYRSIQGGSDVQAGLAALQTIETAYYSLALSNQILFSDWYAHYKFFFQQQIDWINERKKFTWRDKVPLSFIVLAAAAGFGLGTLIFLSFASAG